MQRQSQDDYEDYFVASRLENASFWDKSSITFPANMQVSWVWGVGDLKYITTIGDHGLSSTRMNGSTTESKITINSGVAVYIQRLVTTLPESDMGYIMVNQDGSTKKLTFSGVV